MNRRSLSGSSVGELRSRHFPPLSLLADEKSRRRNLLIQQSGLFPIESDGIVPTRERQHAMLGGHDNTFVNRFPVPSR